MRVSDAGTFGREKGYAKLLLPPTPRVRDDRGESPRNKEVRHSVTYPFYGYPNSHGRGKMCLRMEFRENLEVRRIHQKTYIL